MGTSTPRLNASAAAARLGVSIKALRLYERHGLVTPGRTPAGYRAYGPDDLARAADIAALRKLGLTGDPRAARSPAGGGVVRRQDSCRFNLRAIAGLTACTGSNPKKSSTCRATSSRSLSAQIMW